MMQNLSVFSGGVSNSQMLGGDYRHSFNGMEKDDEVKGEGNSYTTEFRQYDSRIGRWLSSDPLDFKFPGFSPYQSFDNNPIMFNDPLGLEAQDDYKLNRDGTLTLLKKTDDNFDVLYASDEKTGEVDYTNSKQISKSFVNNLETNVSSGAEKKASYTVSNSETESFELFHFLADNTDVEWGLDKFGSTTSSDKAYVISTSHSPGTNSIQGDLQWQYLNSNATHTLEFSMHSHPAPFRVQDSHPSYPSGWDPYGYKLPENSKKSKGDLKMVERNKRFVNQVPQYYYIYIPNAKKVMGSSKRSYVVYNETGYNNTNVKLP